MRGIQQIEDTFTKMVTRRRLRYQKESNVQLHRRSTSVSATLRRRCGIATMDHQNAKSIHKWAGYLARYLLQECSAAVPNRWNNSEGWKLEHDINMIGDPHNKWEIDCQMHWHYLAGKRFDRSGRKRSEDDFVGEFTSWSPPKSKSAMQK